MCFDTLCFSSRLRAADEEASPGLDSTTRPPDQIIVMAEATPSTSLSSRSEPAVEELQNIIRLKDERIAQLEDLLLRKTDEIIDELKDEKIRLLVERLRKMDEELVELRSHLDKFQSVFPFHVNNSVPRMNASGVNVVTGGARPRKQRTGISAEPQSEASLMELARTKFKVYEKEDRLVKTFIFQTFSIFLNH